jgi:hypothetical protein
MGAEATTTTACYHVDADGAMSVNAVAGIEATPVPTKRTATRAGRSM